MYFNIQLSVDVRLHQNYKKGMALEADSYTFNFIQTSDYVKPASLTSAKLK